MSESNDFSRQRLSDFLAARLKTKQDNTDGVPENQCGLEFDEPTRLSGNLASGRERH